MWPILIKVQKVTATNITVQVCDCEATNSEETAQSNFDSGLTHVVNEYSFNSGANAANALKDLNTILDEYAVQACDAAEYVSVTVNGKCVHSDSFDVALSDAALNAIAAL